MGPSIPGVTDDRWHPGRLPGEGGTVLVFKRWVRLRSIEVTCRVEWEEEGSERDVTAKDVGDSPSQFGFSSDIVVF